MSYECALISMNMAEIIIIIILISSNKQQQQEHSFLLKCISGGHKKIANFIRDKFLFLYFFS
jgi:hypothetical protein